MVNYKGKKYNGLRLLEYRRSGGNLGAIWQAECDCGNQIEVVAKDVRRGKRKTCGNCAKGLGIQASNRVITHGITRGRRRQYQRIIRTSSRGNITASEFMYIANSRCLICGIRGEEVEWAEENKRENAQDLISLCNNCSEWRSERSISKFLRYIMRSAQCIQNQISSS